MNSPLNPEQTREIENIRRFVTENPQLKDWEHYKYKVLLLSIFDTLQSKKQYTKAELRTAFEAKFQSPPRKIDGNPIRYEESELNAEFGGWCDAMEHAGLLKEE